MTLDNDPSNRSSIPREVRISFFEIESAKQAEELSKELIYGPKPKFDNDEFGITRVHYIELQLCY